MLLRGRGGNLAIAITFDSLVSKLGSLVVEDRVVFQALAPTMLRPEPTDFEDVVGSAFESVRLNIA